MCTACHIRKGGDSDHTHDDLYEEELDGCRYDDGGDEDGGEMKEKSRARIKEYACEDRCPRKGDEIDGEVETQGETSEGNDDEHLQAEEQNRRCRLNILDTEDVEIDDQETKKEGDEDGFAENRKRTLTSTERFVFTSPSKGLEDLEITVGDYFSFLNDFLSFLNHSHCGREGGDEFGSHLVGEEGIPNEVEFTVISELLACRHRRVHFRERISLGDAILEDGYSPEFFRFEPFHFFEGDDVYFALYASNVLIAGREGGKELFLLLGELFVRLVDGEVEVRGEGVVSPWFAHLKMVSEGVVVPREHKHNDCCEESEDAQTKSRLSILVIGNG